MRLVVLIMLTLAVIVLLILSSRRHEHGNRLYVGILAVFAMAVILAVLGLLPLVLGVVVFTLLCLAWLIWLAVKKFTVVLVGVLGICSVVVALMLGAGLFELAHAAPASASASASDDSSSGGSSSASASSSSAASSSTAASTSAPSAPEPPLNADQQTQVKQQVEDKAPDYPSSRIVVTYEPDWSRHTEERGTTWFCNFTSHTPADVSKCLNGTSERSRAARQQFIAAVRGDHAIQRAGTANAEIRRGLSGNGWIAVQFLDDAQVIGNGYFKDGKYWVDNGKWYSVKAGDVFWLFVARDGHIVWAAVQRADCHNGGLQGVRPVTTATPSAPPVGTPSPSAKPTPTQTHSRSATPSRPSSTPTATLTPTPTPTGKHASLTPSPTGGPVSTGPTSVSHPSSSAPATTTQPTLSSPPTEVQSPSPTSSSPPVTGDPGGA